MGCCTPSISVGTLFRYVLRFHGTLAPRTSRMFPLTSYVELVVVNVEHRLSFPSTSSVSALLPFHNVAVIPFSTRPFSRFRHPPPLSIWPNFAGVEGGTTSHRSPRLQIGRTFRRSSTM